MWVPSSEPALSSTRPKHLYPQARPKYHIPADHGMQNLNLSSPSWEPYLRRRPWLLIIRVISQFKDNRFRSGQTLLRAQVATNLTIKKGRTGHGAQRMPSFPFRFGRKSHIFHGNQIIFLFHKGRRNHNKRGMTFFTKKD